MTISTLGALMDTWGKDNTDITGTHKGRVIMGATSNGDVEAMTGLSLWEVDVDVIGQVAMTLETRIEVYGKDAETIAINKKD